MDCVCSLASLADVFPLTSGLPAVELLDCLCNVLTSAQLYCNNPNKYVGWYYGILTLVDCATVIAPLTPANAIVDGAVLIVQNIITRGGTFRQIGACCRLAASLNSPRDTPRRPGSPPPLEPYDPIDLVRARNLFCKGACEAECWRERDPRDVDVCMVFCLDECLRDNPVRR